MDQLKRIFFGLSLRQRILIVLVTGVVVSGFVFGLKWNNERDLRPLFTNVSPEDAGALVERLRNSKVPFKVADNGTILVPSSRVAELRLEMAAAGLPKTGRIGFEIFDKTDFGVTEFAEQVNYRRALEGELERSVMAITEVERARVHVTFAKESVFTDNQQPAKASVMVKLRPGMRLSQQHILGITHLTASAVEGLAPTAVSVLDMTGALLNRPRRDTGDDLGASDVMIEYRQTLEREVQNKIRTTLDPLLGEDRYRAGVSIDCDFTSGEQSEEIFDPERSVMTSSQKTEDVSGSAAAQAGVPGTASNLPRPVPRTVTGGAGVSRRTESVAYQTSRLVKKTNIPRGSVKRLSVSVLVDQDVTWEGSGSQARRVLVPPSPEKLKVVREVLAGVVGFQQERGDLILVETLPFEATVSAPRPETSSPAPQAPVGFVMPDWAMKIYKQAPPMVWMGAGGALLVITVAGIVVWRRRKPKPVVTAAEVATDVKVLGQAENPQDLERKALAALADSQAEMERQEAEMMATLRLPPVTRKAEVLKRHIGEQTEKNPQATVRLIRTWLSESGR